MSQKYYNDYNQPTQSNTYDDNDILNDNFFEALQLSNKVSEKKNKINELITMLKNNKNYLSFVRDECKMENLYNIIINNLTENNTNFFMSLIELIELLSERLFNNNNFNKFYKSALPKLFDKFNLQNPKINEKLLKMFDESISNKSLSIKDYYPQIENLILEEDDDFKINVLNFFNEQINKNKNIKIKEIPQNIIDMLNKLSKDENSEIAKICSDLIDVLANRESLIDDNLNFNFNAGSGLTQHGSKMVFSSFIKRLSDAVKKENSLNRLNNHFNKQSDELNDIKNNELINKEKLDSENNLKNCKILKDKNPSLEGKGKINKFTPTISKNSLESNDTAENTQFKGIKDNNLNIKKDKINNNSNNINGNEQSNIEEEKNESGERGEGIINSFIDNGGKLDEERNNINRDEEVKRPGIKTKICRPRKLGGVIKKNKKEYNNEKNKNDKTTLENVENRNKSENQLITIKKPIKQKEYFPENSESNYTSELSMPICLNDCRKEEYSDKEKFFNEDNEGGYEENKEPIRSNFIGSKNNAYNERNNFEKKEMENNNFNQNNINNQSNGNLLNEQVESNDNVLNDEKNESGKITHSKTKKKGCSRFDVVESILGDEIVEDLLNAKWEYKKHGLELINELINHKYPSNLDANDLFEYLRMKLKNFKETNFNITREAINIFVSLNKQKILPKEISKLIVISYFEKISDIKLKENISELINSSFNLVEPKIIIQELINNLQKKNNAKLLYEYAILFGKIIEENYNKNLPYKELIDFCKILASNANPQVRNSATSLLCILYKYLGPQMKPMIKDIKESTLKVIEAELDKVQIKEGVKILIKEKTRKSFINSENKTPEVNEKSLDLFPVDISSKITNQLIKDLSEGKWPEKKEACETIDKILLDSNMKILPNGLNDLFNLIKYKLSDKNKNFVKMIISMLSKLIEALKQGFKRWSKPMALELIPNLADKNQIILNECLLCFDKWIQFSGLETLVVHFPQFLKIDNAEMRIEIMKFIKKHNDKFTRNLGENVYKELVDPLILCLQDRSNTVRSEAEELIKLSLSFVPFDCYYKKIKDFKPAIEESLRDILEDIKKHLFTEEDEQNLEMNKNKIESYESKTFRKTIESARELRDMCKTFKNKSSIEEPLKKYYTKDKLKIPSGKRRNKSVERVSRHYKNLEKKNDKKKEESDIGEHDENEQNNQKKKFAKTVGKDPDRNRRNKLIEEDEKNSINKNLFNNEKENSSNNLQSNSTILRNNKKIDNMDNKKNKNPPKEPVVFMINPKIPYNKSKRIINDKKTRFNLEKFKKEDDLYKIKESTKELFDPEFSNKIYNIDVKKLMEALKDMTQELERKENIDNYLDNLDIFLKILGFKLINNNNPSLNKNFFNFLDSLYSILNNDDYKLNETESNIIFHLLIDKISINNNQLKEHLLSLFDKYIEIVDPNKVVTLMLNLTISKNNKNKSNILDIITNLVFDGKLNLANMTNIKLLSKFLITNDNVVKVKCLRIFKKIYLVIGEELWNIKEFGVKERNFLENNLFIEDDNNNEEILEKLSKIDSNICRQKDNIGVDIDNKKDEKYDNSGLKNEKKEENEGKEKEKEIEEVKKEKEKEKIKDKKLKEKIKNEKEKEKVKKDTKNIRANEKNISINDKENKNETKKEENDVPKTNKKTESTNKEGNNKIKFNSDISQDNNSKNESRSPKLKKDEIKKLKNENNVNGKNDNKNKKNIEKKNIEENKTNINNKEINKNQEKENNKSNPQTLGLTSEQELFVIMHSLLSEDDSVKLNAIIIINEILCIKYEENKKIIVPNIDYIIRLFIQITHKLFISGEIKNIPIKFAKYLTTILCKLTSNKELIMNLSYIALYDLTAELLYYLTIKGLEKIGDNEEEGILFKSLNSSMLRIMDNCDLTSVILVLFELIKESQLKEDTQPLIDLANKCLIKITQNISNFISNIHLEKILIQIHLILVNFDKMTQESKEMSQADNMTFRFIRSFIIDLTKIKKEKIVEDYIKSVGNHKYKDKYIYNWIQNTLDSSNDNSSGIENKNNNEKEPKNIKINENVLLSEGEKLNKKIRNKSKREEKREHRDEDKKEETIKSSRDFPVKKIINNNFINRHHNNSNICCFNRNKNGNPKRNIRVYDNNLSYINQDKNNNNSKIINNSSSSNKIGQKNNFSVSLNNVDDISQLKTNSVELKRKNK